MDVCEALAAVTYYPPESVDITLISVQNHGYSASAGFLCTIISSLSADGRLGLFNHQFYLGGETASQPGDRQESTGPVVSLAPSEEDENFSGALISASRNWCGQRGTNYPFESADLNPITALNSALLVSARFLSPIIPGL